MSKHETILATTTVFEQLTTANMSTASPTRPSRRAAARKKIIDESDEDDTPPPMKQEDSEEEFTPAPAAARATRGTRRKTTTTDEAPPTPRTGTRTRKSRITSSESIEPSEMFEPEQENAGPGSPVKREKASPRKRTTSGRQSIRARVKGRQSLAPTEKSIVEEETSILPTPEPSVSPQPEDTIMEDTENAPSEVGSDATLKPMSTPTSPRVVKRDATPLADIIESAINESTVIAAEKRPEVVKVNSQVTNLERPMDIVVRTRNAALPKVEEPTGPTARLVITYLILHNFKSYAGRQEVGPFHASFSSVVGPNGSGKSNVIDSLLFVFGFRASKMRQGKLSALIHNSAAFPDLDHCEVEVHFQEVMDLPQGGSEPIEGSGLVVSRRAFKNNSSSYYINGKTSNYTAVQTLLKGKGIDLDHKRFLILQGEVESIAQMKPKAGNEHEDGLLEYLEDIIGTSKYKSPIEESAAQVEELNEVCVEKSGRVQHVEKEKNSLEDKKEKALAYIRDENELAMKQAALFQLSIMNCQATLEVSQEATAKIQAKLDEELQKHAGNEDEIKSLEKRFKAGSKEFAKLEEQSAQILKEVAKLDKETVKFEEKKKFLANKQKKAEKTLESSKFSAAEADRNIRNCSEDLERNQASIAELQEDMEKEEAELAKVRDALKGKTQGISDEIAVKQKSLEPWNAKVNEKTSAMAVARSELEILREKEGSGAAAIADVEAKIATLEESKSSKADELEQCRSEQKELQKQLERTQAELDTLAKKEPSIRTKLSDARQKADEARASLSNSQSQGNVLTGLMRMKESGRISGFHGRLGNLGTIDKHYDVAISTACPALDNMVVDSVEVGQQCIEFLRKNNLGRANFICLDKLAKRDLREIQTPEECPRLFDLVKAKDEKFAPAFYSVLQDTLVAESMEQANRVAYGAKRWRVVTLEGQLIDKSGTMSGGGTRVAKGGMSSKLVQEVSREQVSKLETDRDSLEMTFKEFQSQQLELEKSLRDFNNQIPRLETKAQKIELELSSLDKNIADAERRIQELGSEQSSSKSDKSRMTALEKTIVSAEKEISKLHADMAGIEEEIKILQDKIMEIGGVKLRTQKAKVDGLKGQIDSLTEEMSSAEVNKAKADKQKSKHEKAYAEAEKELENAAKESAKIEEAMRTQGEDASGSRQAAEEAQEALDTKKEELAELKKELDVKTKELNETRGVEIEIRNKLEENTKALNEALKRLGHWEEKLGKLVVQNIRYVFRPMLENNW